MSTELVVPVTKISSLKEHPNAAMLGLARVLGYQVVVGLVEDLAGPIVRKFLKGTVDSRGKKIPVVYVEEAGHYYDAEDGTRVWLSGEIELDVVKYRFRYAEGEPIVYFPADTIIPDELADKLGVKPLLKAGNRVGKISLRGEPSFGLVTELPAGVDWKEGDNVAGFYGVKKYEPPVRVTAGDAEPYDNTIDPLFDKYTDIQNGRIFTEVFRQGEPVIVTEKIHGTSCRLGVISNTAVEAVIMKEVAGSMELRRKPPVSGVTTYWFPWQLPTVAEMMRELGRRYNVVELFGEVYGNSIQKGFKYGADPLGFMTFDLKINGRFLDWDAFEAICNTYGVKTVPVLARGAFDLDWVCGLANGQTTVGESPAREGVVVKPIVERVDPKVGRAVLKYIGYEYDLLKHKSDSKDV